MIHAKIDILAKNQNYRHITNPQKSRPFQKKNDLPHMILRILIYFQKRSYHPSRLPRYGYLWRLPLQESVLTNHLTMYVE